MKKLVIFLIACIVIFGLIILINKNTMQEELNHTGKNIIEIHMGDSNITGDVNGNGEVEAADYILVRKHLLKNKELKGDSLNRADVNGDKKVSSIDYITIRKILISGNSSNSKPITTVTATPKPIVEYSVTFDSVGGSSVSSQMVKSGGKVTKPNNPTLSGYTFLEWRLNSQTYDFNKTVSSNITLKAVWTTSYTLKTNESKQIPKILSNSSDITYSSSSPSVATVDKNGMIKANSSGYARIIVMSGNNGIGRIEVNVDYGYFDTCDANKRSITTSGIKIYSCLENQIWANLLQGMAVTKDSIIYTGSSYRTWCEKGKTYTLNKYGMTKATNCGATNNVVILTSGNYIRKFDKKTGQNIINYIDVGGHGQSFDATYNNDIYINYFPKVNDSENYGYGASSTGIAYCKFGANGSNMYPIKAYRILNNSNFVTYNFSTNDNIKKPGNDTESKLKYFNQIIDEAKKSDSISSLQHAIDEENNKIAILDSTWVKDGIKSHSNRVIYIYNFDEFKKGNKILLGTYYIPARSCGGGKGQCFHQGIELYGDYIYSVHDLKDGNYVEGISKIKYNASCFKENKDTTSCVDSNIRDIKLSKDDILTLAFGKQDNNTFLKSNEFEGMSVYNGKVYASFIARREYSPSSGKKVDGTTIVKDSSTGKPTDAHSRITTVLVKDF